MLSNKLYDRINVYLEADELQCFSEEKFDGEKKERVLNKKHPN